GSLAPEPAVQRPLAQAELPSHGGRGRTPSLELLAEPEARASGHAVDGRKTRDDVAHTPLQHLAQLRLRPPQGQLERVARQDEPVPPQTETQGRPEEAAVVGRVPRLRERELDHDGVQLRPPGLHARRPYEGAEQELRRRPRHAADALQAYPDVVAARLDGQHQQVVQEPMVTGEPAQPVAESTAEAG